MNLQLFEASMRGITNPDDVVGRLEENDHPMVGMGSDRTVYRIDSDWVVKVSDGSDGGVQNQRERSIWMMERNPEMLCPVSTDYSGLGDLWILQKYAKTPDRSDFRRYLGMGVDSIAWKVSEYNEAQSTSIKDAYSDTVKQLAQLCERHSLPPEETLRQGQWGIYEGNMVLIDYGG